MFKVMNESILPFSLISGQFWNKNKMSTDFFTSGIPDIEPMDVGGAKVKKPSSRNKKLIWKGDRDTKPDYEKVQMERKAIPTNYKDKNARRVERIKKEERKVAHANKMKSLRKKEGKQLKKNRRIEKKEKKSRREEREKKREEKLRRKEERNKRKEKKKERKGRGVKKSEVKGKGRKKAKTCQKKKIPQEKVMI